MKGRRRFVIVGIVVVVAGAIVGWSILRRDAAAGGLFASGTVEATEARLGFQVTGRIQDIAAREGDPVGAGTELAHLDRTEMQARREQAESQVAVAQALLEELERGYRNEEVAQARAARDAALQRLSDAGRDLERTRQLHEGGAVSQEALDKATLAVEIAKSQHDQAAEQLRLLERGPRPEKIAAQRAQLAQAQAALRAVEAQLTNMTIRSAFDGVVTVRHREPGETVPAGSPVLTVMNRDDRWVRIYIREDRVGAVHLGQSAAITSDTYPGKAYRGEVVFIASEAEFTPKSVQTPEERVKLVYAVKVRIRSDPTYDLKPGMPADVRLEQGT